MDSKTLTEKIARRTGQTTEEAVRLLDCFADVVQQYCCDMDTIAIPGFGSFEPKERLERIAVHPATGKRLLVPPKIMLKFRSSALLKQKMK